MSRRRKEIETSQFCCSRCGTQLGTEYRSTINGRRALDAFDHYRLASMGLTVTLPCPKCGMANTWTPAQENGSNLVAGLYTPDHSNSREN